MPDYVSPHRSGTGFNFQVAVPKALRAYATKLAKICTGYIPARTRGEAADIAQPRAREAKAALAWLQNASEADRAAFIAGGGIEGLRQRVASHWPPQMLSDIAKGYRGLPTSGSLDHLRNMPAKITGPWHEVPALTGPPCGVKVRSDAPIEAILFETRDRQDQEAATLRQITALHAEPAPEYTWDGLYRLWRRVAHTKTTKHHDAALKLLNTRLPGADYRHVSRDDARRFRDSLVGMKYSMQVAILNAVKGLYAAAVKDGIMTKEQLPFAGIAVHNTDGVVELKRLPFTADQCRRILADVASNKVGGKRHRAFLWALRVQINTGMRPGEVTQLQRGDVHVEPESGVLVIQVRQTCCVTGKRHPQKTVKTGEARTVPLVSDLAGFAEFAKGDPAEFIFASFPWSADNKRTGTVRDYLRPTLKRLGIVAKPGTIVDGYCFRHRFIGIAEDRGLNTKHIQYVVGHAASLHNKYAHGGELKYLAETMEAVKPLVD